MKFTAISISFALNDLSRLSWALSAERPDGISMLARREGFEYHGWRIEGQLCLVETDRVLTESERLNIEAVANQDPDAVRTPEQQRATAEARVRRQLERFKELGLVDPSVSASCYFAILALLEFIDLRTEKR